jgi:hypothetical protein
MLSLYSFLDGPDEDVEPVNGVLLYAHYPFNIFNPVVTKNNNIKKSKHKLTVDEDAIRIAIKAFLVYLTSLSSCFNMQKCQFIKCGCIKNIKDDHDHAVEYLLTAA